ncbi:MAG: glycosyltransferase family 4 protein [Lentisphaerae bacterium]|nr:glycosyltransferase family 4 protein [Lentisphaerota bacterium]
MTEYPSEWAGLDVSLGHDWLTGMRGGERVLEELCRAFPNAPVHALFADRSKVSDVISSHEIITSRLQSVPGITSHYRAMLPLFPLAINSRPRRPDGDLLISCSHCVAKALKPRPGTRHLCYCFTPMRYAWAFQREYLGGSAVRSILARPVLAALRSWDRSVSDRVDRFIAISETVRARIRAFYKREPDLVYPPVDVARFSPSPDPQSSFDLIVSALVPYKRVDLAVAAYRELGTPLVVVGAGTDFDSISRIAPNNVRMLGWRPDSEILDLYRNCRMLVFPGEEDFGIVPLEAQACGRPVVAFARGGATETVVDGVTGLFFNEQTPAALADCVRRCAERRWDTTAIRAHAQNFGPDPFIRGMAESISATLNGSPQGSPPRQTP